MANTAPQGATPPSGNTAQRPSNPNPGMIRYNTDLGAIEVWDASTSQWNTIGSSSTSLIYALIFG